jgi:hypothetical protein
VRAALRTNQNENGLGVMTQLLALAAAPSGVPAARLDPGTSLDL